MKRIQEMFKKIAEAYAVLSDPSQRKQYDMDNEPRTVLRRQKQEQMWQIIREQKLREARTNQMLWEFQEQERIKYKEREIEAMNIMYV
jgi:DnaJ-class molecular chaperone